MMRCCCSADAAVGGHGVGEAETVTHETVAKAPGVATATRVQTPANTPTVGPTADPLLSLSSAFPAERQCVSADKLQVKAATYPTP